MGIVQSAARGEHADPPGPAGPPSPQLSRLALLGLGKKHLLTVLICMYKWSSENVSYFVSGKSASSYCTSCCPTCAVQAAVVPCSWTEWSWSTCSATCGPARQSGTRQLLQGDWEQCERLTLASRDCPSSPPCPVDCFWGEWTVSGCSATCGQGRRVRERKRLQAAQYGGQECAGRAYELDGECMAGCCPQDCEWSSWSWEACSVSCGEGSKRGRRTAIRTACGGGQECRSNDAETIVTCRLPSCPQCEWEPWGSWSDAVIVDAARVGNYSGLTRSRSANQTGGPTCLDSRSEFEPLGAADPGLKEGDEPTVVASNAALWVTPAILGLILLLLLLLLLVWLCCHCRQAAVKTTGMVAWQ